MSCYGMKIHLGVLSGMVAVTVLVGLALGAPVVSADDDTHVSTATITVPVSCTLSGTGMNSHTATIENGRSEENIGTTTLAAYCNDNGGFAIYAVGYSDDTIGNTYLRDNVLGQANDINTGITFSGANSAWAMKLAILSDSGITTGTNAITIDSDTEGVFSNYHTVPNQYTKVAHKNAATDMDPTTGGVKLTTTYKAYISPTQNAGNYVGKVKYTMVHPVSEIPAQPQTATSGCINYFANAGNAVGTMGCQTISDSDTSAKLFASNFSRAGYGFAGWSDVYDYETNPNAHFYGPNEDITFTAGQYTGSNNGLALYAVWIKSVGNFQDSSKTATICNGLTAASVSGTRSLASVSALTDTRDNQTYAIAKLADGNCWMIENLRIDNTAILTLANTNNPLNDGTDVTLKHNYTDTQTYNTLSATNSEAYNADTAPNGWCQTNSAACDDQSRLRTDNTANRVSYAQNDVMSTSANLYAYGNYYNWYSATAGRGTYGFGTSNNSTAGDLCPTNWRLPKGGNKTRIESNDDNEFWNLVVDALNDGNNPANYASSAIPYYTGAAEAGPVDVLIRTWPNNFVHSGGVNSAVLSNRGSGGNYWSSTAYASNNAYRLGFSGTSINPGTGNNGKYSGRTVRCITPVGA